MILNNRYELLRWPKYDDNFLHFLMMALSETLRACSADSQASSVTSSWPTLLMLISVLDSKLSGPSNWTPIAWWRRLELPKPTMHSSSEFMATIDNTDLPSRNPPIRESRQFTEKGRQRRNVFVCWCCCVYLLQDSVVVCIFYLVYSKAAVVKTASYIATYITIDCFAWSWGFVCMS